MKVTVDKTAGFARLIIKHKDIRLAYGIGVMPPLGAEIYLCIPICYCLNCTIGNRVTIDFKIADGLFYFELDKWPNPK